MADTGSSTPPRCPVDLFDPQTMQDWFPAYDRLRTEAPVSRLPGDDEIYVLTRYADVMYCLRHPELFPHGRSAKTLLRTAAARTYWDTHGWRKQTPLGSNPPEHRHYRALIDDCFDAPAARRAAPMIRQITDELLDRWEPGSPVDVVADFALPLPVDVITRLLGFNAADIPQLRIWSAAWVMPYHLNLTAEQELYVAEQGVAFQRHIHALAERRRRDPADDVISRLATTTIDLPGEDGPRPLHDWELINIVDHLYIGGNETTTFAITSAVRTLLEQPDLAARLRADPSLVAPLVEENLRLESPTQGLFRLVARDVELSGVTIPAGSTVHLRYGAANRDPEMFPRPATVDLDRANTRRHVAFASGEHLCPGAELSRLEQVVALTRIVERFPGLRLAEGNDFRHQQSFVLWALERLLVHVG